jgi:hypothetical protein
MICFGVYADANAAQCNNVFELSPPSAAVELSIARLDQLANQISRHEIESAKIFGGFEVLGGLTSIDTSDIINREFTDALMLEYHKTVQVDPLLTQQAYFVDPKSTDANLVSDFMKTHARLMLNIMNENGSKWQWSSSSLLLLNERIQPVFHNHDTTLNRGRAWGVVSLKSAGTIFRSMSNEIHATHEGESSVFNDQTWHMSPHGPSNRLFLLHFFSQKPG